MLAPLGFIVDEARDGREAVEKAMSRPPRIILMDMVMPGMDGIEATQILRKTLDESTAIIGISASAFQEDKLRFLAVGINAFIAKVFREQELFDVLARYAGVAFETEAIQAASPNIPAGVERPTLEKMPAVWREAFSQALVQGSITRIRRLTEEAGEFDPVLSAYMLDRIARYDLDGLKLLCRANG
jgi:CheY-like chemotaxis protein